MKASPDGQGCRPSVAIDGSNHPLLDDATEKRSSAAKKGYVVLTDGTASMTGMGPLNVFAGASILPSPSLHLPPSDPAFGLYRYDRRFADGLTHDRQRQAHQQQIVRGKSCAAPGLSIA